MFGMLFHSSANIVCNFLFKSENCSVILGLDSRYFSISCLSLASRRSSII
uniref:Uncharacterized protein n=1 Tax=Rhizophora mucronata TaxID=61149 RepID=A0A2P2J0H2_RHIMU